MVPTGPNVTKKRPTLLIDADFFFYRAAQAAEDEHEYHPELTVIVGDFNRGRNIVEHELDKLRSRFQTNDLILFFTDLHNFRKDIFPDYKGNRTKRKPCGYSKLKRWGIDTYPSVMIPNLEADDALGIAATSGRYKNFVLISPDKDLQQIPSCRIFDLKTEFYQTPEEAALKVWEQCLSGDSTDGYSGCPGFGPKTSRTLLSTVKDPADYWATVVDAYESKGLSKEEALMNRRLAHILQVSDWNVETQTPILYQPPAT